MNDDECRFFFGDDPVEFDDQFFETPFDPNIFVLDEDINNQENNVFNPTDLDQNDPQHIPANPHKEERKAIFHQNIYPAPTNPTVTQQAILPQFGSTPGFPSMETIQRECNRITNQNKLKEYLQLKISGDKKLRFNKTKLFCLFNIFVRTFGWKPLTRDEKRLKDLVFLRLFQNKAVVIDCIERFPCIIDQVLLAEHKYV